jgi:methionyl aminopeptidase
VIVRKSAGEIEGMERAGQIVAATIALLGEHAQPGITTGELDRIAEDFIREQGGVPTSKGYRGFPAATCISPNAMVVHGIPGKHRVEEGDLISVDVGVTLDGLVADSAYTFGIGEIDPETQRLLEVGKEALAAGIDQARAGNRVGDISHAVQLVVEGAGFSVVRSLVGHGVGRSYHEEPQIPNFGEPGRGPQLQPGLTLAIEPMITAGGPDVYLHDDEWSISTQDGSLAAHFEHTVAVAEEGPPRILTQPPLAAALHAPERSDGTSLNPLEKRSFSSG